MLNKCKPYYGNMSIKIPYMRKKISTLLTLSAIAMLAATNLLPLFNLVPAQAEVTWHFRTPPPSDNTSKYQMTFDAYGTAADNQSIAYMKSGTVKMTETHGQGNLSCTSNVGGGVFNRNAQEQDFDMRVDLEGQGCYGGVDIKTNCGSNGFSVFQGSHINPIGRGALPGPVECSMTGGGGEADSNRDGDGDGIPDSSDRCIHNSNHRCFKEGDTGTTTNQPQSSSSTGTENQTR
jgi:hypothetical protein